jgi:uncharacterized tellurite resistance protein B-like protein
VLDRRRGVGRTPGAAEHEAEDRSGAGPEQGPHAPLSAFSRSRGKARTLYDRDMDLSVAKCLLVSKVLVADGLMTENERAFLAEVMEKMGLTAEQRRKVIDLEGWDEAEPIAKAMSEDDKRALVDMMVDAASADGRLSPLEMAAVKNITKALGLDG